MVRVTARLPFPDNFYEGVFSSGSLCGWADPMSVIGEIGRVLKKADRFFIGDVKGNTHPFAVFIMKLNLNGEGMKQGLSSSVAAEYAKSEVTPLFKNSGLTVTALSENPFGLSIAGEK